MVWEEAKSPCSWTVTQTELQVGAFPNPSARNIFSNKICDRLHEPSRNLYFLSSRCAELPIMSGSPQVYRASTTAPVNIAVIK